ncbi:LysR family transcriptional regulator [Streptomyces spirodelae]|uniref:LysR family transcriptional regulator n=1 Tax=Streptomyces spirodelae TaxID=2812904 RepID=A0ABS3WM33_9ACTN|nr:LysR family transcriptional regulator [Streptomyces spirodelae]MBO8184170.1 LysR family transcriptional regulator [Streptomyces spirodelae]
MDLVGACRAFVHVGERGSFTVGAAAAGMSQSVASRRVAALEQHLGERLFERGSRHVRLTPFGRELLPAARRLVLAAEELAHEAATAQRRPFRLAVPDTCPAPTLARLAAAARGEGITLELRTAAPAVRPHLVRSQQVRAALVAVPPDQARWRVPLGLASVARPHARRLYLETLRPRRTDQGPLRRVWLQPEDDVPHVRDRMARLRDAVGLRPAQLSVATGLAQAAAEVFSSADLLLCSPVQAQEFGLHWRPVGELRLERTFGLMAAEESDAERLGTRLGEVLADCLGAGAEAEHENAEHAENAEDAEDAEDAENAEDDAAHTGTAGTEEEATR